jgi:hypothetical protein
LIICNHRVESESPKIAKFNGAGYEANYIPPYIEFIISRSPALLRCSIKIIQKSKCKNPGKNIMIMQGKEREILCFQ